MRNSVTIVLIALLMLAASSASASPAANSSVRRDRSNLPITIKSNELSADNKGKTAIFTGKVVAKQGDITIFADKLTINYGEKKGDVEKIEADGSVRIIQENRTGIATHAVYDSKAGRMTLTGNPKVMQGTDTLSGEIITYFIDEERSVATGGRNRRVEATILPPAKKANETSR